MDPMSTSTRVIVTSTHAGEWPRMMVDLAHRLATGGHTMACSPDPSVKPQQALMLVELVDGTLATATFDPTGAGPIAPDGVCNYDHHGDGHRERMLNAIIDSLRRLDGATIPALLGGYKEFWKGHHEPAAALTLWWDARMDEGHTVEHAQFLLGLIAHPDVLSRVRLTEHDGRTRAWLDYHPAEQPNANPNRAHIPTPKR